MKLVYCKDQIRKAAKFIYKKNPSLMIPGRTVDSIERHITDTMFRYANEVEKKLKSKKDWRFVTTGGFWIIITLETKNILNADVLVDPAVNVDDIDYTTEEL